MAAYRDQTTGDLRSEGFKLNAYALFLKRFERMALNTKPLKGFKLALNTKHFEDKMNICEVVPRSAELTLLPV